MQVSGRSGILQMDQAPLLGEDISPFNAGNPWAIQSRPAKKRCFRQSKSSAYALRHELTAGKKVGSTFLSPAPLIIGTAQSLFSGNAALILNMKKATLRWLFLFGVPTGTQAKPLFTR